MDLQYAEKSHSSRSAWIEIQIASSIPIYPARRTPRGVRGLKWECGGGSRQSARRTPRGVRGLKSQVGQ